MGLDKENLIPYDGSYVEVFNGITTCLWGYVELMVPMGDKRYLRSINMQFLVIPCKSLYNCVLGRPFTATLDIVASPIYLKLKYRNLHGDPTVLCVVLEASKRIHHVMPKDQVEAKTIEINVISLIYQLQNMNLHTLQRG